MLSEESYIYNVFARQVIDDFISNQKGAEADLGILVGEWQLLWRSQVSRDAYMTGLPYYLFAYI